MERESYQAEADSGYYGTGRRPKQRRSFVPLVVVLAVTLLAVNGLNIAIRLRQSGAESSTPAQTVPTQEENTASTEQEQSAVRGVQNTDKAEAFGIEVFVPAEEQRRYWELPEGVMIDAVAPEGYAYFAGIRPGDVLLSINGYAVSDAESFSFAAQECNAGDTICVVLYRNGEEIEIEFIFTP